MIRTPKLFSVENPLRATCIQSLVESMKLIANSTNASCVQDNPPNFRRHPLYA
jgi:hypothetical protein